MVEEEKFSKYEKARILGARGLQISMDAPLLIKVKDEELSNLNFDPLKLAEKELDSGVLPISVNRPMPIKREGEEKEEEKIKVDDGVVSAEKAKEIEKEIAETGEIMELVKPEDEQEETEEVRVEKVIEEEGEGVEPEEGVKEKSV